MSTLARDSDILLSIDDVRKAFGVVRRCGLGVEHKLLRAIDGVSLAIQPMSLVSNNLHRITSHAAPMQPIETRSKATSW